MARLLMLQGTGSSVGKSALVAGLCRLYRNRGIRVAPFKAQNMALNSFITPDGAEIGRAQAVQAEACRLAPHVDMNPVLIKPNSDTGAQVIIHGRPVGNMTALAYHGYKETAWQAVVASLERLQRDYELIIIEGAGSPAEINLRDKDIVNMGLATRIDAPVLLVGDIDKGGVFAALVGTLELLEEHERRLIRAFIVNKFRGDVRLLEPGLETISSRCGVPFAGVVPWFGPEIYIPEEDGVALEKNGSAPAYDRTGESAAGELRIGVLRLPHISNFTDFDPLRQEPGVILEYLEPDSPFCGFHLIILPGSKNTLNDLARLLEAGVRPRLKAFVETGGAVVGICGGFQMLGEKLSDPGRIESHREEIAGLGLLPAETEMAPEKITLQARARIAGSSFGTGLTVEGYEIHQGRTVPTTAEAEILLRHENGTGDGLATRRGQVWGCYLHGIFDNDAFRKAYLDWLRARLPGKKPRETASPTPLSYRERKEQGLDRLAALLEENLDLRMIDAIIGLNP
jgi:adenosylcobyric acid synthase